MVLSAVIQGQGDRVVSGDLAEGKGDSLQQPNPAMRRRGHECDETVRVSKAKATAVRTTTTAALKRGIICTSFLFKKTKHGIIQ